MTIVLLTPIGLDRRCWEAVDVPDGAIAHEFPGFGDRPRTARQPTMSTLADDVAAAYSGPLDVVGVSLGGMVAQHLALRHSERTRSLLIACTGAATDRAVMTARAADVEAGGMAAVLGSTLERWFTPAMLARSPEPAAVAYARRTLLALDPGSFADGWRAMAGHDVRERLGQITAPVTCLAGSADAASSIARTADIAERVPTSRLVVLDGPHMMPLERPDEFSAALGEHLRWTRA